MTSRPTPPPPPRRRTNNTPSPAQIVTADAGEFTESTGSVEHARRIGVYGPGGIGKTTLASLAPDPKFLDLEHGTLDLDVRRISPPGGKWSWDLLRSALHNDELWSDCQTLIIDSATAAEELCIQHILQTVATNDNGPATSIESYGYGKGYVYNYELYLHLFADLDQHVRAGRNVVLICHDCTCKVPNPAGEDWERWEPRLQAPPSGKSSIRHRFREWLDELLFIGYDIAVKKSKGRGTGTRTIYPTEMPSHMAKSRTLRDVIPFIEGNCSLWSELLQKETSHADAA